MGSCDKFCWGCRYYISFSCGYCNYRYEKHKPRGCPAGKGCTRREKTRTKREAQGPDEPFILRRPPTANETAISRICAEAERRGTSYGMLVWSLSAAELQEIAQGATWRRRRKKLLEAIRGQEQITPELREQIRELCGRFDHGAAVEEYLLSSNESAKTIAAKYYVSTSTIYAGARRIYALLDPEKEE